MNIWQQMLKQTANKKANKPVDLGRAITHYIAQDSVNKYDRFEGIQGLQVGVASKVQDILTRSDFKNKLQRLGYELSKGDFDYALVAYMIDGKPYIDYSMVAQSKEVAGELVELAVHTQDTFLYNGVKQPVYTYWRKEDGLVYKGQKIVLKAGERAVVEEITYPGSKIPAILVHNNPQQKGDIPQELKPIVSAIDYFGDEMTTEWAKIRTQFINNMLFNAQDGKTWSAKQQAGEDVHDVEDPDSKLQQAIAPMISGSQTSVMLMQQIEFLLDKLLKYSFTMRDTTSTGAQKGTQEISGMNQAEYEYMIGKFEFRTEQLYKFFDMLFDLLLASDMIVAKPKNYTLSLMMSDLEQYKRDNMNAVLALKNGQANQFNGTAANQKAQAELNKAKITNPSVETGGE